MTSTGLSPASKPRVQGNMILGAIALLALLVIAVAWLTAGSGLASILGFFRSVDPVLYWLLVMIVMLVLLGLIGRATNAHWLGVLIDSNNTMSLSRLQVTLWTVLVLSAYLIIALPRIFGSMTSMEDLVKNKDEILHECVTKLGKDAVTVLECGGGPLQIVFQPELILAMGISLASFAGSHIIATVKGTRELDLSSLENKVDEAQRKVNQAQQAFDEANQKTKQPKLDYTNSQDAFTKAQAAVDNPPPGTVQRDLESARDRAKLDKDAAREVYDRTVRDLAQKQMDLDSANEALDAAKKQRQIARTEAEGVLHKNDSAEKASWSEIVRGNEISNYTQVDLGKVQMLFFTVVILLAYGAAIAALLHNGLAVLNPIRTDFPPFSDSLNTLLVISHGAYLTTKATARS